MDPDRVLTWRLATQRLSSAPVATAADAVRLLACVQSQERDHAFWSLALRSRRRTYGSVQREFDRGAFVRTHILRPTWHFVVPSDLRWILELTSPRVLSGMGARHRQLGLDDPKVLTVALDQLGNALRDKQFRTRNELGQWFAEHASPIRAGEQLGHLLMIAELQGLICSGPMHGVHHTYALVDEVIAPTPRLERDEALVELVRRFFTGHGPASVRDFTRWSSLTVADTRHAVTFLGDSLEQVDVDGTPHWYDPHAVPRRSSAAPAAYLLPTYDEVTLTYPQVPFPSSHPVHRASDPFWATVVAGTRSIGRWKRDVGPRTVKVTLDLAPGTSAAEASAATRAARRLAEFLERELEVVRSDDAGRGG
jgi:hypothetical protein